MSKPEPVPSSSGIVPAAASATAPSSTSSSSSAKNNRRKGHNHSNSKPSQVVKWQGASSDLNDGDVFVLKDEFGSFKNTRFSDILTKIEVLVATKFPKTSKAMSCLFDDSPVNPKVVKPEEPQGADREDRLPFHRHVHQETRTFNG